MNLKPFANLIRTEVGFAEYFWALNAADQGFPVEEVTARRMYADKERVIADHPAYKIVEPPMRKKWAAEETFALPFQTRNHGTLWHFYMLGSCASYALTYNECPIKAIDRARERKDKLHWAIPLATVISNPPPPKRTVIGLDFGDRIYFEGRTFELKRAPNDNVSLIEVA
jgi:hypothetical protein